MNTKFLISCLATAAMLACACSKEPEYFGPDPDDDYAASITLAGGTSYDIGGDKGASLTIRITVDHEWYLLDATDDDQSWLEISKTSGSSCKSTKIVFTAAEDNGYSSRKASYKIASGSKTKKLTINQSGKALVLSEEQVPEKARYYQPQEFNFDMLRSDSKWSWVRSKHTEHVVVFWDKEYGEYGLYGESLGIDNTWPTTCKRSSMKVDIDDLLLKAEEYYETNVNQLKFCEVGSGKSVLDDYMFEIYLLYQSDWLATGSGYDNHIGALWVNPSTCQPVGSTIAHEIGHAFQYMTFCDWLKNKGITGDAAISASGNQGPGWRYGFGSNGAGGNAFWEQSAQWQSFQAHSSEHNYKGEAFSSYYSTEAFNSARLHILHEGPRYANYFIHWWWVEESGDLGFIGNLWRSAAYPEDPCETYMRLKGYDNARFNDSMWEYAAHMLTFDFDEVRSYGKNYIGKTALASSCLEKDGSAWRISDKYAPESTGSNAIELKGYTAGSTVTADFEGLYSMQGSTYKTGSYGNAGWRYGFVAYNGSKASYSEIASDPAGSISYSVPAGTTRLWFVVTGAPKTYERHPWPTDSTADTDINDIKWPWQASFTNAKPSGK